MSGIQAETPTYQPEILQLEITPKEEQEYLDYINKNGLSKLRVLELVRYLTEMMNLRPKSFEVYTQDSQDVVDEGNSFVAREDDMASTGYNIVRKGDSFPITSSGPLIFYSMYVRRVAHIAVLLAEMEKLGIITPDQVQFGNKASAVEHGPWELDERDEVSVWIEIPNLDSNLPPIRKRFCHTAELTTFFEPKNDENAIDIANFLLRKTNRDRPNHIPESWVVPDIRATSSLKSALNSPRIYRESTKKPFEEAISNIKQLNGSTLLIMNQDKTFSQSLDWTSNKNPVNTELYQYLKAAP